VLLAWLFGASIAMLAYGADSAAARSNAGNVYDGVGYIFLTATIALVPACVFALTLWIRTSWRLPPLAPLAASNTVSAVNLLLLVVIFPILTTKQMWSISINVLTSTMSMGRLLFLLVACNAISIGAVSLCERPARAMHTRRGQTYVALLTTMQIASTFTFLWLSYVLIAAIPWTENQSDLSSVELYFALTFLISVALIALGFWSREFPEGVGQTAFLVICFLIVGALAYSTIGPYSRGIYRLLT
jgi:hypothetical protein